MIRIVINATGVTEKYAVKLEDFVTECCGECGCLNALFEKDREFKDDEHTFVIYADNEKILELLKIINSEYHCKSSVTVKPITQAEWAAAREHDERSYKEWIQKITGKSAEELAAIEENSEDEE